MGNEGEEEGAWSGENGRLVAVEEEEAEEEQEEEGGK